MLLGPLNLSAGAERDLGEVQLDLGRTVRGTVVDEHGRPWWVPSSGQGALGFSICAMGCS